MCVAKWTQILLGVRWCVMCIFLFLQFYNFIKGIMHIYIYLRDYAHLHTHMFLKNIRQMFLCFTYCSNMYNF